MRQIAERARVSIGTVSHVINGTATVRLKLRERVLEAIRNLGYQPSALAGYLLVLFAMRIAPITQVASAREMSMMIGTYFGARYLAEGNVVRRLSGSLLIAGGVAALVSS